MQILHHTVAALMLVLEKPNQFGTNSFMVFIVLSDVSLRYLILKYTAVLLLNPEKDKVSYLEAVFTLKS